MFKFNSIIFLSIPPIVVVFCLSQNKHTSHTVARSILHPISLLYIFFFIYRIDRCYLDAIYFTLYLVAFLFSLRDFCSVAVVFRNHLWSLFFRYIPFASSLPSSSSSSGSEVSFLVGSFMLSSNYSQYIVAWFYSHMKTIVLMLRFRF